MAERSKATVLKTVVGQPTGGSNPSPSAIEKKLKTFPPNTSKWAEVIKTDCGKITKLTIIIG